MKCLCGALPAQTITTEGRVHTTGMCYTIPGFQRGWMVNSKLGVVSRYRLWDTERQRYV